MQNFEIWDLIQVQIQWELTRSKPPGMFEIFKMLMWDVGWSLFPQILDTMAVFGVQLWFYYD
jgi:hypothetical protein